MTDDKATLVPLRFDEVSDVSPDGSGLFTGQVSPEWTIGGKPNGGYLLSMLGRAAVSLSEQQHVVAASAHYLHSPQPGPVTIEAQLLRAGRSATQVEARMRQDDQVCVQALLTTAVLDHAAGYWDRGLPDPAPVRYEDCPRLIPQLPNGIRVKILDQIEVRLDRRSAGFAIGEPSGRGELCGWLALPRGESFDPISLLFAVDALPPATFDIEFSGWVPTLELTVYVRALPAPGPLWVLQRAQLIDAGGPGGGRVDEACFVWDRSGRLVAQGTQLAGIRLGVAVTGA
jgi:hypothetical protein